MKKSFLILVFFLGIFLTACNTKVSPADESLPYKESNTQNSESKASQQGEAEREMQTKSILQVQTDTQLGSGVLWEKLNEEWIVVTAAHVVQGFKEVDVCLVPEEKILPATVEEINGLDLAFLRVNVASLDEKLNEEYSVVMQNRDAIEEGTVIYTKGYNPYGELCEFSGKLLEDWIYVEDFDNYMMICDCQANPGMSGGAVFTESGSLVGLICGENNSGVLAILPAAVIRSEYELFLKN